jgi:hypothetical protein
MSAKSIVAALVILAASAAAAGAAPCDINAISGTWVLQVTRTAEDLNFPDAGQFAASTTCWFVISRPSNLGIHCRRAWLDDRVDFFAQFQTDFDAAPWHQIVDPNTGQTNAIDGRRRFATPNRCQWRIIDRNDIDIEYEGYFSPDRQSLTGEGRGYQDRHFGATEPLFVTFSGIRQ